METVAHGVAKILLQDASCCSVWWMPHETELRLVKVVTSQGSQCGVIFKDRTFPPDPPAIPMAMRVLEIDLLRWRKGEPLPGEFDVQKLRQVGTSFATGDRFAQNRRARRAVRSTRGKLRALEGGKETPTDTPAQRFADDLKAHIAHYLKGHGGLDAMNVTKVMMQLSADLAMDHGADVDQYVAACRHVFDDQLEARTKKKG